MKFNSTAARLFTLVTLVFVELSIPARAENSSDKGRYSLFNPTPSDQMRDYEPDRPGSNDSSRTIDAGHFKFESGIFNYALHKADTTQKSYTYNSFILGAGLTNNLEFQAGMESFVHQSVVAQAGSDSSSESISGAGNTTARLKWAFVGNDGGALAIALIPALHLPTNTGGVAAKKLQETIELPIEYSLPSNWGLSVMPAWNHSLDSDGIGYHDELFVGISLGHTIYGPVDGYVQTYGLFSNESNSDTATSAGFGFTYHATPTLQLDAGWNFGLSAAADDLDFSCGIAVRF